MGSKVACVGVGLASTTLLCSLDPNPVDTPPSLDLLGLEEWEAFVSALNEVKLDRVMDNPMRVKEEEEAGIEFIWWTLVGRDEIDTGDDTRGKGDSAAEAPPMGLGGCVWKN